MKNEGQREAFHGNKNHRFEEQFEESKMFFLALGYAEFIGICISIQSPIFSGQLDMQIIENKCGIKMWELSSLR